MDAEAARAAAGRTRSRGNSDEQNWESINWETRVTQWVIFGSNDAKNQSV
jgi:hypothetical protein